MGTTPHIVSPRADTGDSRERNQLWQPDVFLALPFWQAPVSSPPHPAENQVPMMPTARDSQSALVVRRQAAAATMTQAREPLPAAVAHPLPLAA
jgi:hypothetical protein